MKKFLAFSDLIGILIWVIYKVYSRFINEIPDIIAYPMMIVSCLLIMIGLGYYGWCIGKKRRPYDFNK